MHKKEGFIGLVMLSIMVVISATAMLWWHTVDLGLRLVKDKEAYSQARYCAELVLREVAQTLAIDFNTWLQRASKGDNLMLSGHASWRYGDKDHKHEVCSTIAATEDSKALVICTTVSGNGCIITMKGLLHAETANNKNIVLDHLTLGNFI